MRKNTSPYSGLVYFLVSCGYKNNKKIQISVEQLLVENKQHIQFKV